MPNLRATVSAGIAQAHTNTTLDSLVQSADLALYRAKMHGRNRVEVAEAGDVGAAYRGSGCCAEKRVA